MSASLERFAIDPKWNASHCVAGTRKRCPMCNGMVEVGQAAVVRDERRQATSGTTPWIGTRQSYTRGAWHLYHPNCFFDMVTTAERLAAEPR